MTASVPAVIIVDPPEQDSHVIVFARRTYCPIHRTFCYNTEKAIVCEHFALAYGATYSSSVKCGAAKEDGLQYLIAEKL